MGSERPAVSEIIGTLFLVGVVFVGITLVGILLLSNPTPAKVPVFNAIISNQSHIIYIYHQGGDSLRHGEYEILVDGVDHASSFENNGDEPWSVGETLRYVSPSMPRRVLIVFTGDGRGEASVLMGSDLQPIFVVTQLPTTPTPTPTPPPSPPTVAWSRSPAFGNATTNFTFTDSSTGGNISAYFWNFNDGNTSTLKSPAHVFPNTAAEYYQYSINHSVTDSGGTGWEATSWLNRSAWVTIYRNLSPTVTFTQDKTSGTAPLTVTFTATQVGAIKVDTWYWTFGDSGTSTSQNPSHTYTATGYYTVSLTATNSTLGVTTVTKANLITASPNPPWYSCSWLYRKNITIDKAKVSGTQSNFPVLISYTDTDLSARAQGDGDDILFTGSDGTTKLFHEIESYSAGTLVAWVTVPQIQSTANTTVYMYYGNSLASSQESPENVWDSNYKAVWHHTGDYLDSTANNNDGAPSSTTLNAGQIADCSYYSGSPYVNVPASSTINNLFAGGGTFSAWIWANSAGEGDEGRIAAKESNYIGGYGWALATSGDETVGTLNLTFRKGFSGTRGYWNTSPGSLTASTWRHVAVAYNNNSAGNKPLVYINGVSVSVGNSTVSTGNPRSDTSYDLRIGASNYGAARDYVGRIDEIRASKTMRDVSWILTEYNNQNSPSTFHYNMTQETWSCSAPPPPPPAFVQATGVVPSGGNTIVLTLPGSSTTGDLMVVSFGWYGSGISVTSVTDTKGNTYSQAILTSWTSTGRAATYYAANIAGGGSPITVTVTLSGAPGGSGDSWGFAAEYSGVATSNPVDQTSAGWGSATGVVSSGSQTTTQATELIYGYGCSINTITANAPYTARRTDNDDFIADQTVSSAGLYEVTGTNSGSYWVIQMVTFKGA